MNLLDKISKFAFNLLLYNSLFVTRKVVRCLNLRYIFCSLRFVLREKFMNEKLKK